MKFTVSNAETRRARDITRAAVVERRDVLLVGQVVAVQLQVTLSLIS